MCKPNGNKNGWAENRQPEEKLKILHVTTAYTRTGIHTHTSNIQQRSPIPM